MTERPTGKELGLTAVRGRLLTTSDVASFLRVSERWVQAHMKDGTFPVAWYLISERDHVVDSVDLDEWLKKTRIQAGMAPLPVRAMKKLSKEEASA
jgi:predicted DNA-binding transcriptional regulator AlpA